MITPVDAPIKIPQADVQEVTVSHLLPGRPVEAPLRALGFDLEYLRPRVEELAEANPPTRRTCDVVQVGEETLMRCNLFGWHPLRRGEEYVSVVGIADRHYRAVKAARQAWIDFHADVFVSELCGQGGELVDFPVDAFDAPTQREAVANA